MTAVDLPPPLYLVPQIVEQIDFDPYNGAYDLFRLTSDCDYYSLERYSTSSSLLRSIGAARSIGSPWRVRTSSNSIDRALDVSVARSPLALDVPAQLADVKRLVGFGWEKIAELLGCSRQAVHRWTLGDPITDANRDRLATLHAALRFIDRGSAEANRSLLDAELDGQTLVKLLAESRFDDVLSFAGRGSGREDAKWGAVDREDMPAEDHWFTRLAAGSEVEDSPVVRAEPQVLKRLQLRKG